MPRLAINYENTIIYKIVCKDVTIKECYVGHTTDFTNRKNCHKCRCNNFNGDYYNFYIYQFIREHGGFENWSIIEIEKFPCKDVNEAKKQERLRMEELKATLNSQVPSRTPQEYIENNIEYLQEYREKYNQNYYQSNKEKILEEKAKKITCICGSIIKKGGINTHERSQKHINFINSAVA